MSDEIYRGSIVSVPKQLPKATTASIQFVLALLPNPDTLPQSMACGTAAMEILQMQVPYNDVHDYATVHGLAVFRNPHLLPNEIHIMNRSGKILYRFLLEASK